MTHHPNTPASIQALRALLDASMVALTDVTTATPESVAIWNNAGEAIDALASRTEQAAPSVASGVESGAVYWHNPENGQVWSDVDVRFHCKNTMGWTRVVIPAAPRAAIAAREQEAYVLFPNVDGTNNDTLYPERALASRQEAPAASAQDTVAREDFDKLSQDLTRAKNLLVNLYDQIARDPSPEKLRGMIERRTGSWFVWGVDRDSAAPTAARSPATVAQPVEGYEHYAAVREGHRNAAEDAWLQAIPNIEPRRAFQAGFDAGYNIRNAAQLCPSQGCGGDEGEAVHVEAVATVVKRRHGLEWELELDWLAEGGISSLAEGAVLLLADSALTGDEGSGTVYRAALSGLEHVGKESE